VSSKPRSRFVVTSADRAKLWETVAGHRRRLGDTEGAQMARWQAANIRSDFPTKRPEEFRP
jgi:hypothetical protein